MRFDLRSTFSLAAALALAACSSSDIPTTPDVEFETITVDASTHTSFVALGAPASIIAVGDPSTSTAWDLELTAAPDVSVNGGASGSGGVKAFCTCANSGLSLSQVEGLTAAAGASAFASVTASSIPPDASFVADTASQAITGWYDYNAATHAISTNGKVWGVRLASTSGAYAKFTVLSIPTPGQSNAGPVTIKWAVQGTASGAMGADKQLLVDLSSGARVYVNLTAGTTSSTSSSPWDVALQGYTVYVNGAAGGGAVAAVPSSFYTSYAGITSLPVGAQGIPSSAFTIDGAGGAFLAAAPYRYDPVLHQVFPTYDVYLVKRGTAVYKVQVTSYYSVSGTYGVLTLRYAKLSG